MGYILVSAWFIVIIIVFVINIIKRNNKIKSLTELCNSYITDRSDKDFEIIHLRNSLNEERAKKEFAKDNTLALFLHRVIVLRIPLQVWEVDASLSTTSLKPLDRIYIKNRLMELKMMDHGYVTKIDEV